MKCWVIFSVICCLAFFGCDDDPADVLKEEQPDTTPADTTDSVGEPESVPGLTNYFPPLNDNTWDEISPDSLNWDAAKLEILFSFLESKNTHGFIILHKGRIAVEKYWHNWNGATRYPIASASKSITAFLVGLAQQEGLLQVNEKTSTYLGKRWSNLPEEKENLITLHHHLSMTTGLDETDDNCADRSCLKYKTDAGKRWAYHNPPYNLLHHIIEAVSDGTMDNFTRTRLAEKIGMKHWSWSNYNLELSTRDMARFGLLIENKGKWNNEAVMKDTVYFKKMLSTSNAFNRSYGYLWWLNGKGSYMVPGEAGINQGKLIAHAPNDMLAAMGRGDKKIYVIPSQDLVVVRHGDDTGTNTFGPSSFDSELWKKLSEVIMPATSQRGH
jgi:CubicO group peptidase (beta-lactamase class C family)